MVNIKICMLGAAGVGKTALIEQFVHSIFTDRYLSTFGVKISKKNIAIGEESFTLMLWDLEGKHDDADIHTAYLRGARGFFLVADGTRPDTLDTALMLRSHALDYLGDMPHMMLLNKIDLSSNWRIGQEMYVTLEQFGIPVMQTSAKTGFNTTEAFLALTRTITGKE